MQSLRRTLAVRFSLTMFLALLLISLWAFLGTHFSLSRQLDESLTSAVQLEAAALAARLPIAFQSNSNDLDAFVRQINRFVTVRDSVGGVLLANAPFSHEIPVDLAGVARAQSGSRTFVTQPWGNRRIRSLYASVPEGSIPGASVVQVTASLEPLAEFERSIFFLMAATVVLGTVATIIGASWLAGSAVSPVATITAQAESVTPGTVGNRITAHADVAEFRGLVAVLNGMLERLDGALDQQRRMIADLGHDLRTPLTAMQGQIEVALRSERSSKEYRRILESCLEEVEHLHTISDGVVMLARIEAGELRPAPAPVDLLGLATDAVRRVKPRSEGRAISVEPSADDAMTIAADAKMLKLVLDHLLDNAIQHTPTDTRVVVALTTDAAGTHVSVDDNGPGIPEEVLPNLFERLYRTDAARTRAAGAGLGLTISAAIMEAHGGSIDATRSSLGGLRISLRFPQIASGPVYARETG
jgi:signal transduction histidine kinase